MASFNPSKKLSTDFNSGNKYVNNVDSPSATDFNNVIESQLYTQEFAERLTDTPDVSQANNVGTPSVEIIDNGAYKKFKFINLKGQTGADGHNGADGATGSKGVSMHYAGTYSDTQTYYNNDTQIDIVFYQGSTYCPLSDSVSNKVPTNTTYWGEIAVKGADGNGAGNLYSRNVNTVLTTKEYVLKPVSPIPSATDGTLQCELVEVDIGSGNTKLDKDFNNFSNKSTLVDSDLIAIQDSADTNTPKANKKATMSNIKAYVKKDDSLTANWHAKQETDGTLTFEFI